MHAGLGESKCKSDFSQEFVVLASDRRIVDALLHLLLKKDERIVERIVRSCLCVEIAIWIACWSEEKRMWK